MCYNALVRFGKPNPNTKEEGGSQMKFDYSKLLGRMREMGYTQEKLAKAIGINESTLHCKLSNKSYFNGREIDAICAVLNIPNSEIGIYFYSH
jgi:DNA-binding XRE family transcriptional regulator